ncbi:MAG: sulfatase [Bythopirellula sp.]
MIVTDDCNCDLGCYGRDLVRSPHIDQLAERGVRFTHAYSQYPVCNASRSSFMTSLYPGQTGVFSNKGDLRDKNPNVVTLSQMFRNHGYTAARVGKIYHYGVPNQIGTDGHDDLASWDIRVNPRGIDREVHDQIHSIRPDAPIKSRFGGTLSWLNVPEESEHHTDGKAATAAIDLLKKMHPQETGRPFFLAVGFYRPHTPYVAPSRLFELYSRQDIDPVIEKPGDRDDIPVAALHDRPGQRELSLDRRREIIQAYYASISLMDEQLGRVVDALGDLGLADDTVVVFLSDHGYHLGAHGLWQKSDLFEGSCRVPLIVCDPSNAHPGQVVTSPVELVDLYPTLADLCQVTAPDHVKGISLQPVLDQSDVLPRAAALSMTLSRAHQMHKEFTTERVVGYSIRNARYRYTQWGEGKYGHELYDYETDPDEYTNLADLPQHADVVKHMQTLLKTAKKHAL